MDQGSNPQNSFNDYPLSSLILFFSVDRGTVSQGRSTGTLWSLFVDSKGICTRCSDPTGSCTVPLFADGKQ